MSSINISTIADWIEQKRLDPRRPITLKSLVATRALRGIKDGVKLLADGASKLTVPIKIIVSRASQSAIAAVEAVGGTVITRYYTPQAITQIRKGTMHPYISLRWDPVALEKSGLDPRRKRLGMTPEERVTGLGYQYRLPDPSSRKELEYYRDEKNRGYLAHTVKEGESASLYFKPPPTEEEIVAARRAKGKKGNEAQKRELNRMW